MWRGTGWASIGNGWRERERENREAQSRKSVPTTIYQESRLQLEPTEIKSERERRLAYDCPPRRDSLCFGVWQWASGQWLMCFLFFKFKIGKRKKKEHFKNDDMLTSGTLMRVMPNKGASGWERAGRVAIQLVKMQSVIADCFSCTKFFFYTKNRKQQGTKGAENCFVIFVHENQTVPSVDLVIKWKKNKTTMAKHTLSLIQETRKSQL